MFRQTIFGMPMQCLNRNCKARFHRESHLGYRPKNEVEVFAIMRCPACKDTFAVTQMVSMVQEYKDKLPIDPSKAARPVNPITRKEIERIKKNLASDNFNPLPSLFEGLRPGTGHPLTDE